ncbi:hypothetical protein FH609_002280 [Streptomyces sp. 3MP-14]|nr:hypothetical protein FH609_002280 [Streptomyces sp. 3MP-14]
MRHRRLSGARLRRGCRRHGRDGRLERGKRLERGGRRRRFGRRSAAGRGRGGRAVGAGRLGAGPAPQELRTMRTAGAPGA